MFHRPVPQVCNAWCAFITSHAVPLSHLPRPPLTPGEVAHSSVLNVRLSTRFLVSKHCWRGKVLNADHKVQGPRPTGHWGSPQAPQELLGVSDIPKKRKSNAKEAEGRGDAFHWWIKDPHDGITCCFTGAVGTKGAIWDILWAPEAAPAPLARERVPWVRARSLMSVAKYKPAQHQNWCVVSSRECQGWTFDDGEAVGGEWRVYSSWVTAALI